MIGQLINDRYRLEIELGHGGAGTIFRAYDTLLNRAVAVKMLASQSLGSQGRARMLREAQAAARLNHPNIVSVYDAGESSAKAFIIMELVEGDSLHEKPPKDLEESLHIFRQVCAALEHAHQHGIVHRDLKPENVLLTTAGVVKLTDFGLARPAASRLTTEGEITGTVYYMAPEQALGQEVNLRADLYSLGVMLYEAVAGQLPFTGDDPITVISQHLYAPLVPPRLRNAKTPPVLDALIVQLMSKSPADRPSSAGEVLRRLELVAVLESPLTQIEEPALLERMARGRIVGRERELREARALWMQAKAGDGQTLLVSGEPGIGKSRLAREIITLAEVSGGSALIGECYPEGGAPYAPFAHIFRQVLSDGKRPVLHLSPFALADLISIAPDLQMVYPAIGPNPRLDPAAEQQRLFESARAFFAGIGAQSPCLLVLEDAHWADHASLSLLRHLARQLRSQRVMILGTYREVELDEALPLHEILLSLHSERLAHRLKLTRLDRKATGLMLTALLGEEPPHALLEGIYQETEGNPFFIEEVCKALLENGQLVFVDGRWQHSRLEQLQIPQSVRMTIQTRLSKLPAAYLDVLRTAAILGREFDFEILSAACDQDEVELIDALERAENAQLVEEVSSARGGMFRFVHALIPLTLVEGLSGLRRRRLHRTTAEVIETLRPSDLEALAYQYSLADEPEKAKKYLKMTGDRARARFANEDAIRYYSQALEFSESGSRERFELLADRAAVYHLVARRPQQLADVTEMLSLAEILGQDDLRFDALIAQIDYFAATDFLQASLPSQSALVLAEEMNDPERQGRALHRLATAAWRDGDLHRSISYLEQAMEMFQQAGLPGETISCLHLLSLNAINLGEHEKGQLAAEKAVALSRQHKDRRQEAISLRRLGITLNAQERSEEALALYQQALAMHREVGDRTEECNALNVIGALLIGLDRLEEARPYFLQGLEISDATGNDFATGMLIGNYVDGYFLRSGSYLGALEFLELQTQKFYRAGDRSLGFIVSRLKSMTLALLGQYPLALSAAQEALALAEARHEQRNRIDLRAWIGRLHALAGDFAEARRCLESSLEMVQHTGEPETYIDPLFHSAYIAWLDSDSQAWQLGRDYARQVVSFWRKARAPFPLMYALDMEARLSIALGETNQALLCSTEALQIAEKQGRSAGLEQVYFTHARVLQAVGRKEDWRIYLERAYGLLMELAGKITQDGLKQGFLENVRYNREIVEESRALKGGSRSSRI